MKKLLILYMLLMSVKMYAPPLETGELIKAREASIKAEEELKQREAELSTAEKQFNEAETNLKKVEAEAKQLEEKAVQLEAEYKDAEKAYNEADAKLEQLTKEYGISKSELIKTTPVTSEQKELGLASILAEPTEKTGVISRK